MEKEERNSKSNSKHEGEAAATADTLAANVVGSAMQPPLTGPRLHDLSHELGQTAILFLVSIFVHCMRLCLSCLLLL